MSDKKPLCVYDGQIQEIKPADAISASRISADVLGTPTYDNVQDYINSATSAGRISGGVIAAVDATHVSVTAVKCMIRTTNSATGQLVFADVAENTNLLITADTTNYIYVDYNSGSPIIAATTDRLLINKNSQFVLGAAWGDGEESPHVVTTGMNVSNWATDEHSRIVECHRVQRASGAVISASGTRNIKSTDGVVYVAGVRQSFSGKDTSGTDKFTYIYRAAGSGWTEVADQTQINNTNYDDGDGTLGTLTAQRYGVHWVYILYDGDLYVLYGQGDYTLAQAQAAQLPGTIPDELQNFGILAAKIIIQKEASSFTSVISAYTTLFGTEAPTEHNNLAGLQGGTAANYYHVRKYADITAAKAALGTDGAICFIQTTRKWYQYVAAGSAYTANDATILITGDGGNTRWIAANPWGYFSDTSNLGFGVGVLAGITTGDYNVAIGDGALPSVASTHSNIGIGFEAGYYTAGSLNVVIGHQAGKGVTGNSYSNNVFIGYQSGFGTTTGGSNVFIGHLAGYTNSSTTECVYIGYRAGYSSTGGGTFVGTNAGTSNTTGNYNVFLGHSAGRYNTEASYNTSVGYAAGRDSTTGTGANVCVGYESGRENETGTCNVVVGYSSGRGVNGNSYTNNTFIGCHSGLSTTIGGENFFGGYQSGYSNSSGNYNTYLGSGAGYTGATINRNTFVGYQAGYLNVGSYNTSVGMFCLYSNASGTENVGLGYYAGRYSQTGSYNVLIGMYAGYGVTGNSHSNNTFIGYQSGYSITTGGDNFIGGYKCGYTMTSGASNVMIGADCAYNATGASNLNVIIGHEAGHDLTTAVNNVFLGAGAGHNFTTGGSNICLGYLAGPTAASTSSDLLYIHNAASDTPLIQGNFSTGLVTINSDLKTTKFGVGLTPIARRAHVADPTAGSVQDAEARTAINSILATLEAFGFHEAS